MKIKVNEYIADPVGKTDNEGYHKQIEIIFDKVPTAQGWDDFIKYVKGYDPNKAIIAEKMTYDNIQKLIEEKAVFEASLMAWLDDQVMDRIKFNEHTGARAYADVQHHIKSMIAEKPKVEDPILCQHCGCEIVMCGIKSEG